MRLGERILRGIVQLACRRSKAVVGVFLLVTTIATVGVIRRGKFSANLADILPKDMEQTELFKEFTESFASDTHYVALSAENAEDIEAAKPFLKVLSDKLLSLKNVKSVRYKLVGEELKEFLQSEVEDRLYVYLDEVDRKIMTEKTTPEAIEAAMRSNRKQLDSGVGTEFFRARIAPDPLNLLEILQRRKGSTGGAFAPKDGENYFISPKTGTIMLMFVAGIGPASNLEISGKFMNDCRMAAEDSWNLLIKEDAQKYASLKERITIEYAGGYALMEQQHHVLRVDLLTCLVSSLIFVMMIFALGFRRMGALFYIGFPLAASILWTLATAFFLFGHISIMSGGFAAILVGLSVDFAIHLYNGYVLGRERGLSVDNALEDSVVKTGPGIFYGALTSSFAFFGIMLTSFTGLSEFGFLAGIGVLYGMIAMFFVMPALLSARNARKSEPAKLSNIYGFHLEHVSRMVKARPGAISLFSVIIILIAGLIVYKQMTVYFFDSDLKSLRPRSSVIKLMDRMQSEFGTNINRVGVLSRGNTSDEALSNAHKVAEAFGELSKGQVIKKLALNKFTGGKPSISVDGTEVRIRRAEIVFPPNIALPTLGGKTANCDFEITTESNGNRIVCYGFASQDELIDWEIIGDGEFNGGVELDTTDGKGALLRWKYDCPPGGAVSFSTFCLGEPSKVNVNIGEQKFDVANTGERTPGAPWPLTLGDQVNISVYNNENNLTLYAGRGTMLKLDSITPILPSLEMQKASASYVAGLDVARILKNIDSSARAHKLNPKAFRKFTRKLKKLARDAKEPNFLTLEKISESKFSDLLSKYYRTRTDKKDNKLLHSVATFMFPEDIEAPRRWFDRVAEKIGESGDVTASRMVSLSVRDIVYGEYQLLMALVVTAVLITLLFSFRHLGWALAALLPVVSSFALMLAFLLIMGHRLNYMNVIVFPILVGIGIDYGIHVIHKFRAGAGVDKIITETGRAFVLTTLTTLTGFGSLVLSRYPGLRSFGFVSIVGMLFVLLSSLIALPAFLEFYRMQRAKPTPTEGEAIEQAISPEQKGQE